jgi:competence protein ComEA
LLEAPGMARRVALLALLGAVLAASRSRRFLETPAPRAPCAAEGRGVAPRHWLGCAADPGPPRALAADERLALGLAIDPNTAGSRELAFVPGLSRHLAEEVVQDRERNGRYVRVEDLLRVRGIGPRRLATAGPHLRIFAP